MNQSEADEELIFIPLGGVGEFGKNLALYGFSGAWIMVDCGMAFANYQDMRAGDTIECFSVEEIAREI